MKITNQKVRSLFLLIILFFNSFLFADVVKLNKEFQSLIINVMMENEETRNLYIPNSEASLADVLEPEVELWMAEEKNAIKLNCEQFMIPYVSCFLVYTDDFRKISYAIRATIDFLESESNKSIKFAEIFDIDIKYAEFD